MSPYTILLVEDNAGLMKANRGALAMRGYRVLEAGTLKKARHALEAVTLDLFVLDIMLPDGDGRDFCRELRERHGIDVPILFLTALKSDPDMARGYDVGATDYLTKPFRLEHLTMKIEALLRQQARAKQAAAEFCAGSLRLDYASRTCFVDGGHLDLSPKEFALLEVLVRNRGGYLSADELYRQIWKKEPIGDTRTVKEHIYRLRDKLGNNESAAIEFVQGRGYRLMIKQESYCSPGKNRSE